MNKEEWTEARIKDKKAWIRKKKWFTEPYESYYRKIEKGTESV